MKNILVSHIKSGDVILLPNNETFKVGSVMESPSSLNYITYGNYNRECKIKTICFDYDEYVNIK